MLEVSIEARLLNAETSDEIRRVRRVANRIRRRWRNREASEFGMLDLGGEA